jgi:anthranilate phosphoribosyltransferase
VILTELLPKLLERENLSREDAGRAADCIMDGRATPAQIAGFLVALRMKGETAAEVAGFVESMRNHSVRIEIDDPNAVDGVGTGGDGAHTFNVSTAAGIVASAAGVTVAKHGNRSVSSKCGSADLLEAAGGEIDPGPDRVCESINRIGFGFMFAPRFHPAMKLVGPPRRELGVRTIFNILGPMTNPAGVRRLLLGVYDRSLMLLVAEVLKMTAAEHVLIVHSRDGLDEISVSAPTDCLELNGPAVSKRTISPSDFGFDVYPPGILTGGEPSYNARILNLVLEGEPGAYRDAVALNAGAMLYVGGKAASMADGLALAIDAIDSGRALQKLNNWLAFSRQ